MATVISNRISTPKVVRLHFNFFHKPNGTGESALIFFHKPKRNWGVSTNGNGFLEFVVDLNHLLRILASLPFTGKGASKLFWVT